MALLQNTLATELQNMVPVDTETEGINNFASAFETYFLGATVVTIPVNAGSLTNSKNALKGAMTGAASDAATAIQNGIIAFWAQVAIDFLLIWTVTPPITLITPPPNLGTLAAALNAQFALNITGELSLVDATAAIAGVIHPTQLGGLATLGPPPPPGVPTPIL
jgi:hypothetical protein